MPQLQANLQRVRLGRLRTRHLRHPHRSLPHRTRRTRRSRSLPRRRHHQPLQDSCHLPDLSHEP